MTPAALAAWILSVMLSAQPPGRSKIAAETEEEGRERYRAIAEALADVVAEEAPLYGGAKGRLHTAALVLAVAHHESGFRRDVDLGSGPHARGGGRDSCLVQIRVSSDEEHARLVADRRACFREGLRRVRQSLLACRKLAPDHRLSAYASGTCTGGLGASRAMVGQARRWLAQYPYREGDES